MPSLATPSRPENASNREFAASEWKPYIKNTLRGFCTITMPSGMILHGCTLHEKDTARWIGLPAQKLTKADGTTTYAPIVEFATKDARDRFNTAALRAVDRFLASQGGL